MFKHNVTHIHSDMCKLQSDNAPVLWLGVNAHCASSDSHTAAFMINLTGTSTFIDYDKRNVVKYMYRMSM